MKKHIVSIAIAAGLLAATPAIAAQKSVKQACSEYAKVGRFVMTKRQAGYSMAKLMDRVNDQAGVGQVIVQTAYNKPRYQTDRMQKRAIDDFANEVYAACFSKLGS